MSKFDFILADTTSLALKHGLDLVMQQSQADPFGTFIVVAPESKTIMIEKYLLSISKTGAFANIYVYSLKRLLNKISPINNKLVLSKSAGTMIVRKIILSNLDKLVCYKKTATTNGFAEIIYGTISQLKSSAVSVADFYDMINGVSSYLKIKMQDIALIYDEYQQYIENHYIDQSDLYSVLEAAVENSQFIENSNVYFLGFESVTAEALTVCKKLAAKSKQFIASCSYMSNGANAHIADNEVFNKLKQIADEQNYVYIPKRFAHKFGEGFAHIKDNLYAYPAKVKIGTKSVEVLSALRVEEEVDFVAQKISQIIKNGGLYKQIALVVNGLETYQEKIEQVFSEYGFSYFIAKPYDFSAHPLFKLIKSYMNVCRKNYEATDCIEFLSNILISSGSAIDDFINYVNQYGINHNKFTKPFTVFDEKILSVSQFRQVEKLRSAMVKKVELFKINNATATEYISAIKEMLSSIEIDKRLLLLEELQSGDAVSQNITKQAKQKLDNTLDQIEQFLGNEKMSVEMFENILISGLSVSDVSLVPISQDCIVVGDNTDGLMNIDYLFILNCSEGSFPTKQQDCGIILDKEIGELNGKSSKTIEPTIKTINRRERYKAYETLLLPSKKLILSFSQGSGENVKKASNVIDQIIGMFGGEKQLSIQKYSGEFVFDAENYLQQIPDKICSVNKAIKYVCSEVGNKRAYGNFENIKLAGAAYKESKMFMPKNLKQALENINSEENYQIDCSDKLYFKNQKTSTSQLEKYFTCPFLFFTNYGLRLKENLSSKLKALDVGNILHKVAEIFMQKLLRNNNLDVQKTAQNIVKDIISKEYVAEDNKFLLKIVSEEAVRLCEKLQYEFAHSFFKPVALEQSFGKDNQFGAVDLLGGQIQLEGKIDRVDVCENRFRIIDYKTGKIEDNIKRVFYGKKIQLVTYLLAMQKTGLKPAGVVYFPIRNEFSQDNKKSGKMKGFFVYDSSIIMKMDTSLGEDKLASDSIDIKLNKPKNGEFNLRNGANLLTDKQFEAISSYVQELCSVAISEILQGNISPSPIRLTDSDRLPCTSCVFAGVCGVENTTHAHGRKCYGDIKIDTITKWEEQNGK